MRLLCHTGESQTMQNQTYGGTRVTVTGRTDTVRESGAVAALCAAVARAVQTHQPEGCHVREVVVMLEEGTAPLSDPAPVYVDVYDSGYGHGI